MYAFGLTSAADAVTRGARPGSLAATAGALGGRVADAVVPGTRRARRVLEADHAEQTQHWKAEKK